VQKKKQITKAPSHPSSLLSHSPLEPFTPFAGAAVENIPSRLPVTRKHRLSIDKALALLALGK